MMWGGGNVHPPQVPQSSVQPPHHVACKPGTLQHAALRRTRNCLMKSVASDTSAAERRYLAEACG